MAKTQFAIEMGMGTDLKGQDFTKAAVLAVKDALHRNYRFISKYSRDLLRHRVKIRSTRRTPGTWIERLKSRLTS